MTKNLSAAKRSQTSLRNNLRNKNYKSSIKTIVKKIFIEINNRSNHDNIVNCSHLYSLVSQAYSKIDKAVQKGVMHKNSAARKKSMVASKLKIR